MKIYTKTGDGGYTSLLNNSRVSKTDDRIELLGAIDELSAHLGLAKAVADVSMSSDLSSIQSTLIKLMAGVASNASSQYRLTDGDIEFLEQKIDTAENGFERQKGFVLYGGCELSARLDVARAVARRAERDFCRATRLHRLDTNAQKYLNRLADFLYICARCADCKCGN
ncbi:MAG: cob(I)yrinic acid a,c-diamide adenosyltransferase [Clostridia bacterium]|nr:cob(I)yrinic acid a,c-diamide adenosyltransferase [Clostridia bacterium]